MHRTVCCVSGVYHWRQAIRDRRVHIEVTILSTSSFSNTTIVPKLSELLMKLCEVQISLSTQHRTEPANTGSTCAPIKKPARASDSDFRSVKSVPSVPSRTVTSVQANTPSQYSILKLNVHLRPDTRIKILIPILRHPPQRSPPRGLTPRVRPEVSQTRVLQ